MFVVEFRVDSPILQETLAHAPKATISYEEMYQTTEQITLIFWVNGGFTAFEDGITADPTVMNFTQLAETETRRLYRVAFTEIGENVATFPSWSELDISLLNATATHEGWNVRMRMPDRDALRQYRKVCEESGLQFRLKAIYEESDGTAAEAELTNSQREALVTARDFGYFDVPRQTSLEEIADHCGVSSQAVSERIRRGTATLVDIAM